MIRDRATALLLALLLAACGDGGADETLPPADGPTTTRRPTTTSTMSTTLSPEDEVEAAYRVSWDALLAATNPPDPDNAALARHVTGPALETARRRAERLLAEGKALFGTAEHDVEIRSLSGETALLWDCSDDGLYEAPSDEPLDSDVDEVRIGHEAHMVTTPEGWKLEALYDAEDACA